MCACVGGISVCDAAPDVGVGSISANVAGVELVEIDVGVTTVEVGVDAIMC